jgi:hypothetical protein
MLKNTKKIQKVDRITQGHGNGKFTNTQAAFVAEKIGKDLEEGIIVDQFTLCERLVLHGNAYVKAHKDGREIVNISKTIGYEFLKKWNLKTPSQMGNQKQKAKAKPKTKTT